MNTKEQPIFDDFDDEYESYSPCCHESFEWLWDEGEMCFLAECGCMKRYRLRPTQAIRVRIDEDFENDEEDEYYD